MKNRTAKKEKRKEAAVVEEVAVVIGGSVVKMDAIRMSAHLKTWQGPLRCRN